MLGGLLAGGAAFAAAFYLLALSGLDSFDYGGDTWPSLIIGAAVGLLAGVAGGFLTEIAARVVLLPFLGRALWRAPLLAFQLIQDSDYVAGLRGRWTPDGTSLLPVFDINEVGRETERLISRT